METTIAQLKKEIEESLEFDFESKSVEYDLTRRIIICKVKCINVDLHDDDITCNIYGANSETIENDAPTGVISQSETFATVPKPKFTVDIVLSKEAFQEMLAILTSNPNKETLSSFSIWIDVEDKSGEWNNLTIRGDAYIDYMFFDKNENNDEERQNNEERQEENYNHLIVGMAGLNTKLVIIQQMFLVFILVFVISQISRFFL